MRHVTVDRIIHEIYFAAATFVESDGRPSAARVDDIARQLRHATAGIELLLRASAHEDERAMLRVAAQQCRDAIRALRTYQHQDAVLGNFLAGRFYSSLGDAIRDLQSV
jgi:hypothetical protein